MGKLTETQKQEIVQMYTSGEFKAKEIAEMFAINQQTVYNTLAKNGIKPNNQGGYTHKSCKAATVKTVVPVEIKEESAVPVAEPETKQEIKTCKKCGKEIAHDFLFCPYCGEKSKTQGEIILEGLLHARSKAIKYVPEACRQNVDKQLLDASEYLRLLMRKTGQF